MEAAPHQEPERAREEVAPLGELIREVIDNCEDDTRLLLEAVIFERLSFRQLEERFQIPKSVVHRLYAAAILELRAQLIEYPQIVEYLDSKERKAI